MKLTDILTAESIVVPLAAKDKTGVITELVERLAVLPIARKAAEGSQAKCTSEQSVASPPSKA